MILLALVILLAVCGTLFYGAFRVVRWMLRPILRFDVSAERQSVKLSLRDWFQWNVAVQPGKGVASGSMHLNPPVKSSFVIATACFVIAALCSTVTRVIIPGVFACFGLYHLMRALRSLCRRRPVEPATVVAPAQ